MRSRPFLVLAGLLIHSASVDAADLFREEVAPLLQRRCVGCHNGAKKRGGLDLTTRMAALQGGEGGPALVPGAAGKSLMIKMVSGATPRMPRAGARLTDRETATLRRWIDAGAPWPSAVALAPHGDVAESEVWWSLRPLTAPPVPATRGGWGRNPVDAFVLEGLQKKGLRPAPEADRRTLIRRLAFDLHGLPPAPEEVEAFVADRRPDAYERLVDRLLVSPRYGERWGRHWLDVAHYGDTHGYDKDKRRDNAWPYRDYVIRAFNADIPYERFIKEQIAGDVLYPNAAESVAATGFVVAGPWDFVGQVELREGTVDKEKTRVLDRDDMVSSTLTTFLSLTVGCARCHDHKFDPIPQKDYYRLQAVFAGVERGDRRVVTPSGRKEQLALTAERRSLATSHAAVMKKIAQRSSPELLALDGTLARLRGEQAALPAPPPGPSSPTNGYHSGIMPGANAVKWVQVDLGAVVPLDAVRLIPARPVDFRDAPGFGFPVRFRIEVADEPSFRASRVLADHSGGDFPNPGTEPYQVSLAGVRARHVRVSALRLWKRDNDYVFALGELQVDSGGKNVARGVAVTALDSIEAGRWSMRHLVDGFDSRNPLPEPADGRGWSVFQRRAELGERIRTLGQARESLVDALIPPGLREEKIRLEARLAQLDDRAKTLAQGTPVFAVVPRGPRPIRVFHRGDVEQPRQEVNPGGLSCLSTPVFTVTKAEDEGARRAALAEWIADRRNPLTWRSAVNRVWHQHFGRGLVDTPSDFGRNGSLPTHPELLDWLAAGFRDQGGSLKALHRLLVTSATYRQSSRHDPEAARVDGDNRLLWRMNRRRLDAESVRDAILAVSGRLDLTMGGPGFALFRFKDDHSPIYDHADPARIHDPATYRRTVYRFTVRSVPNPFLDSLDCADPNINTPVRNTTLTALQALALLNNPFVVRQSAYFADRLKDDNATPAAQIDRAFRLALGRPPSAQEQALVLGHARAHGLPAACRVLFNANEFIFID